MPGEESAGQARNHPRMCGLAVQRCNREDSVMFMQFLAHLVGDFWLQNDWMALNKKRPGRLGRLACALHCLTYTLPFLLLTRSWKALLVIMVTHYVIDRTNLIAWLVWAKNKVYAGGLDCTWAEAKVNGGFHPSRPIWLAIWLCIICDNTLHLILNALALKYL